VIAGCNDCITPIGNTAGGGLGRSGWPCTIEGRVEFESRVPDVRDTESIMRIDILLESASFSILVCSLGGRS